ncbi:MAG: glycogen-debranching protein [Kofleriaceae bacterium]
MSWAASEGLPYPLGVTWCEDEAAYNFALYSKHATSVRLVLFGANDLERPHVEVELAPLVNKSGRIWHCRLAAERIAGCRYYGYRVDGPEGEAPFDLHAFCPDRVLADPYARSIVMAGSRVLGDIEATAHSFEPMNEPRPRHDGDALIYELHVGGFTRHESAGVRAEQRGTFAGVIEKIPYLRELGVTVVEVMPVFQFDQTRDYWGYMPITFFAPHRGYARPGSSALAEFRSMTTALHRAGIEVIVDAVYNHTAEGGAGGPTYNFKGIDNSTYYLMRDGTYADFSGCGNSINARNRYVRKMLLDSMRFWANEMQVDGFRFDLASVFARDENGQLDTQDGAVISDIASDPTFDGLRMIAEPWDSDASALGRAFPGVTWLQWNARFRDDVRRFLRGDPNTTASLIRRIYGSDDLFPDDVMGAYHAYQSVNYITSHDGFTLYDLLSYTQKRNHANGHDNLDGPLEEWSSNCGHEGDDGLPPSVLALRERQAKNAIALALLANGTPMLRAGDELLQTQRGNSNPYNQDNATSWLDWSRRDRFPGHWRFVQQMIAFRRQHPAIARSRFWRDDVRWFGPNGVADLSQPKIAWSLDGASQGDRDLYVIVNGSPDADTFVVQQNGHPWRVAIDTARPSPDDIELARPRPLEHPSYVAQGRSVVVLVR